MKKPYVLVESDGTSQTTHVYIMDEDGGKTKVPFVSSVKWEASASGQPILTLELLCPKADVRSFENIVQKIPTTEIKKDETKA